MRPPPGVEIQAPEFPPKLPWLNVAFLRMATLLGRSAVLLEFWDFARVNSLRTLPYLLAWHERYRAAGLRVVGMHAPGYSFGRDNDVVAAAVERLEIPYPVGLDAFHFVWRQYAPPGWPARYLWDRRGLLRHFHFGEGEYEETERAIHEVLLEIDPDLELPEPLAPLRPEDAPGVLLEPQSADIVLPAERDRLELVRDWTDGEDFIEARDSGAAAMADFTGGGAWAVLSGADLTPGVYETDGTVVADDPGLRLHGFQFTPEPPGAAATESGARRG